MLNTFTLQLRPADRLRVRTAERIGILARACVLCAGMSHLERAETIYLYSPCPLASAGRGRRFFDALVLQLYTLTRDTTIATRKTHTSQPYTVSLCHAHD